MATEDNKELSRRFLEELWNQKNMSIIDELLADTCVVHTPPLRPTGSLRPEALKQLFEALQNYFSDIHISVKDQIAEEDKVVTQMTWDCTLKSDDPSTDSTVNADGVGIDRIDSGKIVENWNTLDVLYMILKLRKGPPPQLQKGPPPPWPPPALCSNSNQCPPGYQCLYGECL